MTTISRAEGGWLQRRVVRDQGGMVAIDSRCFASVRGTTARQLPILEWNLPEGIVAGYLTRSQPCANVVY